MTGCGMVLVITWSMDTVDRNGYGQENCELIDLREMCTESLFLIESADEATSSRKPGYVGGMTM